MTKWLEKALMYSTTRWFEVVLIAGVGKAFGSGGTIGFN